MKKDKVDDPKKRKRDSGDEGGSEKKEDSKKKRRVEDNDDGPGAFRACLDVGLARTSTGAKVTSFFHADQQNLIFRVCHCVWSNKTWK